MRHYLIVDDNRAYAENLAEILQESGDEVSVATSGLEALSLARATPFDAVVTDMQMPGMNGGALLQELRKLDRGLVVLVVTAFTRDAELERARRDGLLAVLPKPTPVERLSRLLERARHGGLLALVQDRQPPDPASEKLREALEEQGFTTVRAATLDEVERIAELAPFAAVVDLRAGEEPESAVIRMLRTRSPDLPVIVAAPRREAAQPEVPLHLLARPFNPAQLLEAVEQIYQSRPSPPRARRDS